MLLTGKIKTLSNTGNPNYTICGQSKTALSFTNMGFRLSISKANQGSYTLVNESDFSSIIVGGLPYQVYNFGSYDVEFVDFKIDAVTSSFQANLQVYYAGTTDVVTWERFYVYLEITKVGYQSFSNTFELYNYDVGNSSSIGTLIDTTGNIDFEPILINNTNNLDNFGVQTRAASSFITLRRPFSKEIHVYNMIGTQGNITYATDDGIVGYGKHIVLKQEENLYIEQTISLASEYCVSGLIAYKAVWTPEFVTSYDGDNECNGCTNTIQSVEASFYFDASNTSVFNLNGTPMFLTEFMSDKVLIEIFNYLNELIKDNSGVVVLTYALWTSSPATFTTPIVFNFTPDQVGDNIISITNLYYYAITVDSNIELYKCVINYDLKTCKFWTVTNTEVCNIYKITNCSANDLTIVLQRLQDDLSWEDISTEVITAGNNLDYTFADDGVYMFKASSTDITGFEYYTLPVYCALQDCLIAKLNETICHKITASNCMETRHYELNAFLANAHTLFLMLNKEFNWNFLYSTISTDKLNELFSIKTYIDRIAEYCADCNTPCIPCNK